MSKIKDFIIGAFMSLSKVEQEQILTQVKKNEDSNSINQETPIRKQEIKIISNERFNEILQKADESYKRKYGEKFDMMRDERGIDNFLHSFKNQKFEPPLYEQLEGKIEPTYSFNTSNSLNKHCSTMYVTDIGNNQVKLFFNIQPESIRKDFSDLEYFYVYDVGTLYTFIEISYDGTIFHNETDSIAVFTSTMIKKEPERKITQESVMSKKDLIDPREINFERGLF